MDINKIDQRETINPLQPFELPAEEYAADPCECDDCSDPSSEYNSASRLFKNIQAESFEFDPLHPNEQGKDTGITYRVISWRYKDSSHEFTGAYDCMVNLDPFPFDSFEDAHDRMVALAEQFAEESINFETSEMSNHRDCGAIYKLRHVQLEYPNKWTIIAGWKTALYNKTYTIAILQILKV